MAESLQKSLNHLSETRQIDELRDFLCYTPHQQIIKQPKSKTNKGLANKMTGMLNTIKDVFPTFEDEQAGMYFLLTKMRTLF